MNAKYWLFAATLFGTACLEAEDDKDEESEPSDDTDTDDTDTSEPSVSVSYITQNYFGDAVVTSGTSYEGSETFAVASNATAGTGNLDTEIVWSVSGTSIDAPTECGDCVFSFDVALTFDAAASTDPDGSGANAAFGYALGTSDYGTDTLFYGNDGSWGPWLVNGQDSGADTPQVVSFDGSDFTYDNGVVDYYYAY